MKFVKALGQEFERYFEYNKPTMYAGYVYGIIVYGFVAIAWQLLFDNFSLLWSFLLIFILVLSELLLRSYQRMKGYGGMF